MDKNTTAQNNIVKAAMKLAYENGISNVSVKSICEYAGVSRNTFYHYFDNKEAVFGDSFSSSDDEKMAALPDIFLNFDSPMEQLWEFMKIDINRQINLGPKLIGTFAVMNVQHDSFYIEDEEHLSSSLTIALAMLKKMQRLGEIENNTDAFVLLKIICGCFIAIDLRWAKMNGSFDFKKEVYDQTMAVLRPVKEIENY